MRTNWVKMILLAFVFPLLTGCWDAMDIEERDIETLLVLDKTQDGYRFIGEFAKPSSSKESQNGQKFVFLEAEGPTIVEARAALNRKADLPIYLGAINAVVLTGPMADFGIEEYMYRLREMYDYRKTVSIVTTDGSPESFTEVKSEKTGAGKIIESTLKNLVNTGQLFTHNLADILEALTGQNKCFLLPSIAMNGNDIEVSGFSVFHSGKRIGVIPVSGSKGIILLMVDKPYLFYTVPYESGQASIMIKMNKKELKPSFQEGKVSFSLSFAFTAELHNTSSSMPVTENEGKQINDNLQRMVLQDIADAVQASQQTFQCDYLNFSNTFRIAYPVKFRNMDWSQEYSKAEVMIEVTTDLDITGSLDYEPRNQ